MKTARFRYFSGPTPPAPFVQISAAAPGLPSGIPLQLAQLDTGAFKTVIPLRLATDLGLLKVRELRAEGLDGAVVVLPSFLIELMIKELSAVVIEVLASEGEPYILLGRDVLNRYLITLDGPQLGLTIQEP
jgi:predicted aspartyl protease